MLARHIKDVRGTGQVCSQEPCDRQPHGDAVGGRKSFFSVFLVFGSYGIKACRLPVQDQEQQDDQWKESVARLHPTFVKGPHTEPSFCQYQLGRS